MIFYPSISVLIDVLVLKLKGDNELKERKTKVKTKVWKDVDEVVKATIEIPKRVQWLVEVMEEVPKRERSLRD
nr:MAG TPA: hypothetical protein [Caudoviricetes sp.]